MGRKPRLLDLFCCAGGTYVGPDAMGIDWMTGNELCEAIPPAYTRFIGEQLVAHLESAAQAEAA